MWTTAVAVQEKSSYYNTRCMAFLLFKLHLIRYWGYEGEQYVAETADGYLLEIQRIPYGKGQVASGHRPVVFLQHGLEGCSTNWLTNLPSESLGLKLHVVPCDLPCVLLSHSAVETFSVIRIARRINQPICPP